MRRIRLITLGILLLLLAIIVVQNQSPVQTHLLFITVEMSYALLLFLTGAVGFAMGILVALRGTRNRGALRADRRRGNDARQGPNTHEGGLHGT